MVKAQKEQHVRNLWSVIRGGLFWTLIIWAIFSGFIYELYLGKPTSLYSWGEYLTVYPNDLSPLTGFFIFAGIFIFIGPLMIGIGIYGFFRKGGYFIGTPLRMITYNSYNELKVYKWNDFLDKTDMFYTNNRGNLTLKEETYEPRKNRKIKKNKKLILAEVRYANEILNFCSRKIDEANNTAEKVDF